MFSRLLDSFEVVSEHIPWLPISQELLLVLLILVLKVFQTVRHGGWFREEVVVERK
jgi:hypothetical protein